ncbi:MULTISPECIES: hypothetical protein [unclassified Nocardia]|uniref:hypothetical protein n=1 Tax=unclassified Nocardia TaxID=2637762 RepID=UPI0024A7CF14|nr:MULTISPECIES: hypothetical protein [unclassified Nocardia]
MAIVWYWALAQLLARTGVDIDEVFEMVNAWQTGTRRVRLELATDTATGLRTFVISGRADNGRAIAAYARHTGRDIYIFDATYLTEEQIADFERWEATHHD